MDFKLNKSDYYLILAYFSVVMPLSLMDYYNYDNKTELFAEVICFALSDIACLIGIVGWIFPRYLPQRKYFHLLFWSIIYFTIIGHIFINTYCYFSASCTGNWFSLKAAYAGLSNVSSNFAILGVMVLGKKLYDSQLNYLKVEKEKKESELLRLNSQLDPHFLFNNLNTIDSLIDTDPSGAKVYLNKLSQLYRYLIASKEQEVVELEEELDFVQNYIYLIQSRFGETFQFEIDNQLSDDEPIFIPPGALQTLLENTVKHNQANPKKPIFCKITISEKGIEVSNNLVPKKSGVDSTGTGLKNLQSRYQLLTDKAIQIIKNEHFTVALPLIKQVA